LHMMPGLFLLMLFVLCLGVLLAGAWAAVVYTSLSGGRKKCMSALLELQSELEARYGMLPELVEAARVYMRHERAALDAVLSATSVASSALKRLRESPLAPGSFELVLQAEEVLDGGVMKFFAISEAYPEMKADPKVRQLVQLFLGKEARVQDRRAAYNQEVDEYNKGRMAFPAVHLARLLGSGEAVRFDKAPAAEAKG